MQENKICPVCGTVNKNLNLRETDGLYVCCLCQALVDTKAEHGKPTKCSKSETSEKDGDGIGK